MKNKILVIGTLLFVGLLLFGCSSGSVKEVSTPTTQAGNSVTQAPAEATQTPAPTQVTNIDGQVGSAYEISYMSSKYQVTLEKTAFESSTNSYYDKRYLLAFFEIKNTGDGSGVFSPNIYAIDAETEKYDKTIVTIGISDEYEKTLDFFKQLPPGTKMSGWAAIEIPKDKNDFDLFFEYSNIFIDKTPKYIKYKVSAG